jgi:photosystem II stability/assembly factor-like uncharacterized protein
MSRTGLWVGFVVGALTVGFLGLQASPAAAARGQSGQVRPAATAPWSPREAYPAYLVEVLGISCPRATTCWVLGEATSSAPAIAVTTDGGKIWKPETLPTGIVGLDAISCPTTSDCWLVGGTESGSFAVATTNGGATWKSETLPSGLFVLSAVSCPTTTDCWAVGSTPSGVIVIATTNGGGSWTSQTLPSGLNELNAVACATAADCWAVGNTYLAGTGAIVATTNGGATWKSEKVPAGVGILFAVSCKTTTDCVAAGVGTTTGLGTVLLTSNRGKTWAAESVAGSSGLSAVSCPTTSRCTVAGSAESPGDGVDSESTGPFVASSIDGGRAWKRATLPTGIAGLSTVSCPTRTECWVGGATETQAALVIATNDSGRAWASQTLPTGIAFLRGAYCPTTTNCFSVGFVSSGAGGLLGTTDAGGKWNTEKPPSRVPELFLFSVTCRSSSDCWAVGDTPSNTGIVVATTDAGAVWKLQRVPSGTGPLYSVSCATSTDCWAAGATTSGEGDVVATTNGGSTWVSEALALPSPLNDLNALSCPSTSECWASGNPPSGAAAVMLRTTDGGKKWASQKLPSGTAAVGGIACPSVSDCYAVGYSPSSVGLAVKTTDGGAKWVSERLPSGIGPLLGLSCPRVSECFAAGAATSGAGRVVATTNSGRTWEAETLPAQTRVLYAVACPTARECFAFGLSSTGGALIISTTPTTTPILTRADVSAAAVPKGFKANSITWLSAEKGWILGAASCGAKTCTYVIGTSNGGKTWSLDGRVDAPIAKQGLSDLPGITEVSFSTPKVGWAFGPYLYHTTDRGASWASEKIPGAGKQVLSLSGNARDTFAIVSTCAWMTGGFCPISLWKIGTARGSKWVRVSLNLPTNNAAEVSVFGKTVYVVDSLTDPRPTNYLYASTNGGTTFSSRPVPCNKTPHIALEGVAPSSATSVGLLCNGDQGMSLADKYVYVSDNTGRTDTSAGPLAKPDENYGIEAQLAMSPSGNLAVAASSDGSFIYINDTHKTKWTMVIGKSDGGLGWNDLVYVTDTQAWVVYAPADTHADLGDVYVTNDAGRHWSQVSL